MKTKIILLVALSAYFVTISKAQYYKSYPDSRVVVQGQVILPGKAIVAYNYQHPVNERYVERVDRRIENRRDWREVEYDRYCRSQRNYRMSREDFYRKFFDNRNQPYCTPVRGRY